MKLIEGMIFGAGTGLITSAIAGLADSYNSVIMATGSILILVETTRLLLKTTRTS